MIMRIYNIKWQLLSFLLLSEMVHAQEPPPPYFRNTFGPVIPSNNLSPLPSSFLLTTVDQEAVQKDNVRSREEIDSARQLVSAISVVLQGCVHLNTNLSCAELAAGPWKGAGFSQELLGLVMVPVLASAECVSEAQDLVLNLYMHLGQNDTQELLNDIATQIRKESKGPTHTSHSSSARPKSSQVQAIMFNIQRLAEASQNLGGSFRKDSYGLQTRCQGWIKVKDTVLLGEMADDGQQKHPSKAKQVCQSLGFNCAGISIEGNTKPGLYHIVLRPGSRLLPSGSSGQSESWIQNCGVRLRRRAAPGYSCLQEKEVQVFKVVEWIPVVSTLYNLGTAVYYASVKCSDAAVERAVLSAVDLGTDALMAATGGTAGVAGFFVGTGVKTGVKAGVKYLLNNMDENGDLLLNQNSSEDGTFIIE